MQNNPKNLNDISSLIIFCNEYYTNTNTTYTMWTVFAFWLQRQRGVLPICHQILYIYNVYVDFVYIPFAHRNLLCRPYFHAYNLNRSSIASETERKHNE